MTWCKRTWVWRTDMKVWSPCCLTFLMKLSKMFGTQKIVTKSDITEKHQLPVGPLHFNALRSTLMSRIDSVNICKFLCHTDIVYKLCTHVLEGIYTTCCQHTLIGTVPMRKDWKFHKCSQNLSLLCPYQLTSSLDSLINTSS